MVCIKIAIIDADLIGREKHRFPNLVCMKLSGYYKNLGHQITLKTNYDNLDNFDTVFVAKVFTDTPIDENILTLPNVKYGGTGFFYDQAAPLPYEIEHHMPDYHLYDEWIAEQINKGYKTYEFKYYIEYSIGFTTRGCFRKCDFCVNKKYDKVSIHSPLSEFIDVDRKYICLLDDNILGYTKWNDIFTDLSNLNKYFEYKQGMDIRLLTEEKAKVLSNCNYKINNGFVFAFDDFTEKDLIIQKLKLWRKYYGKTTKLYVLCAYDRSNTYDDDFWIEDLRNTFERIKILMKFGCIPYVMKYNKYLESPYKDTYVHLAGWTNNPREFYNKSYEQWCIISKPRLKSFATIRDIDILKPYFKLTLNEENEYQYKNIEDISTWNGVELSGSLKKICGSNIKTKSINCIITQSFNEDLYERILKDDGFICVVNNNGNFRSKNFDIIHSTNNFTFIGFNNNYSSKHYLDYYGSIREYIKDILSKSQYKYSSPEIIKLFYVNNNCPNEVAARQISQQRLNPNYNQFSVMTEQEYNMLMPFFNFDKPYSWFYEQKKYYDDIYTRLKKDYKRMKKSKIDYSKIIENMIEDTLSNIEKRSLIVFDRIDNELYFNIAHQNELDYFIII